MVTVIHMKYAHWRFSTVASLIAAWSIVWLSWSLLNAGHCTERNAAKLGNIDVFWHARCHEHKTWVSVTISSFIFLTADFCQPLFLWCLVLMSSLHCRISPANMLVFLHKPHVACSFRRIATFESRYGLGWQASWNFLRTNFFFSPYQLRENSRNW